MNKIVIIGTGNVGTNLAVAFANCGIAPVQIISRNKENAQKLAEKINCPNYSYKLADLIEADFYFLCTNDNAIQHLAESTELHGKTVIHTSGSTSIDVLRKNRKKYGVFYPLQTFNKHKIIDFDEIPVCIEGSDSEIEQELKFLAEKISDNVHLVNSEQRLKLHIAAVFVNNFVNHLFAIANEIIERENLQANMLEQLIKKTLENAIGQNPKEIQTGPARRNDTETIAKHLTILKSISEKYADIYKVLSDSIISLYKN